MLTGVIDPAGAAAAEPGQGMVLLRNISPIRYGIEVRSQGPPVGRSGCSAWLQRGIAECRQKTMAGNFDLQRILGNMPGMAGRTSRPIVL